MADQKTNATPKRVTKPSNIRSVEQAVNILVGAGIKVDVAKRTQTWIWGRYASPKVISAAAFLDSYKVEQNEQFTTNWFTEAEWAEKSKNRETV